MNELSKDVVQACNEALAAYASADGLADGVVTSDVCDEHDDGLYDAWVLGRAAYRCAARATLAGLLAPEAAAALARLVAREDSGAVYEPQY